MNASRILPELQASLMCEAVRPEASGSFLLLGVVNFIRVPQLPVTIGQFCVYNRWTAGVGRFKDSTRLVTPDGMITLCRGGAEFELRDPAHHATNVIVFPGAEFKTAGTYFIEVLVDDMMKLRSPLSVVLAPPPRQSVPNPVAEPQQA
jgi:hypothetical protein